MAETQVQSWSLEAERDIWRAVCAPNHWHGPDGVTPATHKESLWWFLNFGWGAREYLRAHPSEPQWLYKPIHHPYCAWLQHHILRWKALSIAQGEPEQYRILSLLPRGYGKTVSATKCAALWSHLDDPKMTTLIASATGDLSEDIMGSIAAIMEGAGDLGQSSWFTWLYGNWKQGSQTWKPKEYIKHGFRGADAVSEGSFEMTSAEVGMTGYHHRQHWWDDPIYANKLRDNKTAYLRSVLTAFNASYDALHANGLLALTCTRYLDADVAGRAMRDEGVATWSGMDCPHMHLFDKVPFGRGLWHVYFMQTENELTGEITHPRLWTRKKIDASKRRDAENFSGQQQNNPGSGEKAPLVESQIPFLYMSYPDFHWDVVEPRWATIHIDTAFKTDSNIREGDFNAIVVWLSDPRDNGVLYLDTDLIRHSDEWREEDFNKELVKVCSELRRRRIFIRAITDEVEPGGKSGTYKNRILGILRGAGFMLDEKQFVQLNRHTDKKGRIRTAAGHWAEGYVRILLHKNQKNEWIVPKEVSSLVYQILKVNATQHDDLADAATDGFIPQLWMPPMHNPGIPDGMRSNIPMQPGDDDLKWFSGKLTDAEIIAHDDEMKAQRVRAEQGYSMPVGFDDDGWVPPRSPV
jgi:hypothetical protein